MSQIPFIWHAEIFVNRGPVDAPLMFSPMCSANVTNDHGTPDISNNIRDILEKNAVEWLAEQIDEDPERMTVISLTWSS